MSAALGAAAVRPLRPAGAARREDAHVSRRDQAHLLRTEQQRCELVIRQRVLVGEALFEAGLHVMGVNPGRAGLPRRDHVLETALPRWRAAAWTHSNRVRRNRLPQGS
jgi:hypothetical protein